MQRQYLFQREEWKRKTKHFILPLLFINTEIRLWSWANEISLKSQPSHPQPHILFHQMESNQHLQKMIMMMTRLTSDTLSSSSPWLYFILSFPLHNLYACGTLESCVIIPSICLWACQYAKQASAIFSRQQQLLEPSRAGKRREVKSIANKRVARYLQSGGVYPISGQEGKWGEATWKT